MKDLLDVVFGTPTATLLVVAGVVFLLIAVVGNVAGKIEPGKAGRIASGVIGGILLTIGLGLHSMAPRQDGQGREDRNPQKAQQAAGADPRKEEEEERRRRAEGEARARREELEEQARKQRQPESSLAKSSPESATRPTQTPSVKPPRPLPVNDIWNFRAIDVSEKALEVGVDYVYNGGHGTGQRYIYMSAVALQRDGTQVPRTHFEGFGGPGEVNVGNGTSKMLIRKNAEGSHTSEMVRICMIAREPSVEVLCKTFPYVKAWN